MGHLFSEIYFRGRSQKFEFNPCAKKEKGRLVHVSHTYKREKEKVILLLFDIFLSWPLVVRLVSMDSNDSNTMM